MSGGIGIMAARSSVNITQQRVELITLAVIVCAMMFELIRRRHLLERYALLWLAAGLTVLILALWKGLLSKVSHLAGIGYGPSALFAVSFLFVLLMLVQFSVTISRLSDQNTMLAQRLALLQERLEQAVGGSKEPAEELEEGGFSPSSTALD